MNGTKNWTAATVVRAVSFGHVGTAFPDPTSGLNQSHRPPTDRPEPAASSWQRRLEPLCADRS
jgi:hypothetical protein